MRRQRWSSARWRARLAVTPAVLAGLVGLVGLVGITGCTRGTDTTISVVEVVDGDTVVVAYRSHHTTVRLLGIDTPETVHPTKAVECFGPEASAHLGQLLTPGTEVRLERDTEARDHFGRLLAYVHRLDGLFVNVALVEAGLARAQHIAPNDAYRVALAGAQRSAKASGAGLWSACP